MVRQPKPWKISSSMRRISWWIASLCSGVQKANISTLVNWWTRYRPARVAARRAGLGAEAVRQADVLAAAARGSSKIWSRCMPPSVISAVAIRHRSVSAMV